MYSTLNLDLLNKIKLEFYALSKFYFGVPQKPISDQLALALRDIAHDELLAWIRLCQPDPADPSTYINPSSCFNEPYSVGLKMVSSWAPNKMYGYLQRNNPLKYLSMTINIFNIQNVVVVVRSPKAQIEAWMRRKCTFSKATYFYNNYLKKYKLLPQLFPQCNFHYIKFSDFVAEPFKVTDQLGASIGIKTHSLTHLRVAKKPSLNQSYQNHSNKISRLYTPENIFSSIDPLIEEKHISNYSGPADSSALRDSNFKYLDLFDN